MATYKNLYIANAFSINMLENKNQYIHLIPETLEGARAHLDGEHFTSAIGHADTARIVGNMLGIELPDQRINVTLHPHDGLLVAQYTGPRLAEGATKLPEGASINFWMVEIDRERTR